MRTDRCARVACAAPVLLFVQLVSMTLADETAGISGRVVDRSGDPVPGALVTLTCGAEATTAAVRTDENGRFHSPRLSPGTCTVEASLPNLARPTPRRLELVAGALEQVDLMLDIDVFQEYVLVTAPQARDSVESREIRESFAHDVGEAAARIEGVHKIRKGGLANDVVLRGFKGENLNVQIDGHKLYGACPNRMDPPAFHVDFAEVERIEVKKGALDLGSSGSLGGSVNIVTREPDSGAHASLQATAGSFGSLAPSLTASYAAARWSVLGGYAERRSDPYEDGDGTPFTERANYSPAAQDERAFDVATYWIGTSLNFVSGHRLDVRATRQTGDSQLYPYLQMDSSYDDADRFSAEYVVQSPFGSVDSLRASVSYAAVDHFMTDALRVTANGKPRGYSMATEAESSVWNENVQVAWKSGVTAGIEAYQRDWQSSTMLAGMAYRPQSSIPGVAVRSAGIFVEYDRSLDEQFKVHAGIRVDRFDTDADPAQANTNLYYAYHGTRSTSRSETVPSAGVAVTYTPEPRWEFFAGLGRTTRAPDPLENYFALQRTGSDWVGNPDLVAPTNTEVDLGIRFRAARLALEMSAFDSAISDFIAVVDQSRLNTVAGVANDQARSYLNNDARMRGGEATAHWTVTDRLVVSAGASYVRGTQNIAASHGILDGDLPEIPPLSGHAALRYDSSRWFVAGEVRAAARQDQVDADLLETTTPGWGIVNLRGGVTIGRFSIVAGIDNVLDRSYAEHLSYQRDPFRSGARVNEPGTVLSASLLLRY